MIRNMRKKGMSIRSIARKLTVIIYNMLAKKQEFLENHMFKLLLERKLKSMETRSKTSFEFKKEDMEKAIGEITMQTNFFMTPRPLS